MKEVIDLKSENKDISDRNQIGKIFLKSLYAYFPARILKVVG